MEGGSKVQNVKSQLHARIDTTLDLNLMVREGASEEITVDTKHRHRNTENINSQKH